MRRRPPISKRTDTLLPDTTLFRSAVENGQGSAGRRADGRASLSRPLRAPALAGRTRAAHSLHGAGARLRHLFRPNSRQLGRRSEEHTSELQSLMRISYAVFCLNKKQRVIQTAKTPPNNYQSH